VSVVDFPEIEGHPFAAGEPDLDVEADPSVALVETTPPATADLVEWTPERAASLVRAVGFALHTFDPATELDGGAALWRATAEEAEEIATPLSRILARYEPVKKLAGVVDEAELGAAFVSYAKRNMRERGRVVLAAKEERREVFGGDGGED